MGEGARLWHRRDMHGVPTGSGRKAGIKGQCRLRVDTILRRLDCIEHLTDLTQLRELHKNWVVVSDSTKSDDPGRLSMSDSSSNHSAPGSSTPNSPASDGFALNTPASLPVQPQLDYKYPCVPSPIRPRELPSFVAICKHLD